MAEPRLLKYSSTAVCYALHAMSQSVMQTISDGSSSSSDTVEGILRPEHDVLMPVALLLSCWQLCGCYAATLQYISSCACAPNLEHTNTAV